MEKATEGAGFLRQFFGRANPSMDARPGFECRRSRPAGGKRRGRLLKLLLPALLFFTLSSASWAQGSKSDAPRPLPQREKLILAFTGKTKQYAAVILAKSLGEFDKENLDVEFSVHKPTDSFLLLTTGQVDVVATMTSAGYFNAVAAGADMKVVAPVGFLAGQNGVWVSRAWLNGRTYTPSMLKGQVIANVSGPGTVTDFAIQTELAKAGLTMSDFKWKQMAVADILLALENGAVNFGLLLDPFPLKADTSKVMFAFPYVHDVTGGYFFGTNLLTKKRAVGEAFVRALTRTVRLYLQDYGNNRRVVTELAKELQITEDQVRASATSIVFPADMLIRKDFAEIIQKIYFAQPGLMNYAKLLPDEKVVDRAFLKELGLPAASR